MLVQFPPEVLEIVVQFLPVRQVLGLWFCGDKQLHYMLGARGGLREMRLVDNSTTSTSRWPRILHSLTNLTRLKVVRPYNHLVDPEEMWRALSQMHSLRHLYLECKEAEEWLFEPIAMETAIVALFEDDQDALNAYGQDLERPMRNLSKFMPELVDLCLSTSRSFIEDKHVFLLPRTLVSLRIHKNAQLTKKCIDALPAGLTRFATPLCVTMSNELMDRLPKSLVRLRLDSSDPDLVIPDQITRLRAITYRLWPIAKYPLQLRRLRLYEHQEGFDYSSLPHLEYLSTGTWRDNWPAVPKLPSALTTLILNLPWSKTLRGWDAPSLTRLELLQFKLTAYHPAGLFPFLQLPPSVTAFKIVGSFAPEKTQLGQIPLTLTSLVIRCAKLRHILPWHMHNQSTLQDVQHSWPPKLRELQVLGQPDICFSFEHLLTLPVSVTILSLSIYSHEFDEPTFWKCLPHRTGLRRIAICRGGMIWPAACLDALPATCLHILKIADPDNYQSLARFTNLTNLSIEAKKMLNSDVLFLPRSITKLKFLRCLCLTSSSFIHLPRQLVSLKFPIPSSKSGLPHEHLLHLPRTLTHLDIKPGSLTKEMIPVLPTALGTRSSFVTCKYHENAKRLQNEPFQLPDPRVAFNSFSKTTNFY